jgi:hypothetical protein
MPTPNQNIPETIEIRNGRFKGTYTIHPVAALFPFLRNQYYDQLKQSIKLHGQQEAIVIHGKFFLDGRTRISAINELDAEPKVIEFEHLGTGLTPDAWILVKNLERRHLTDDQRLAIAAKYSDWCKEENTLFHPGNPHIPPGWTVIEREDGNEEQKQDQEYPQNPAEKIYRAKRGRPPGKRTEVKQLSLQTKQSRYRAEQILKLREHSPELAVKVEEGTLTLKEAVAQLSSYESKVQADASENQTADPLRANKLKEAVKEAITSVAAIAEKLDESMEIDFWTEMQRTVSKIVGAGDQEAHDDAMPPVPPNCASIKSDPINESAKTGSAPLLPMHSTADEVLLELQYYRNCLEVSQFSAAANHLRIASEKVNNDHDLPSEVKSKLTANLNVEIDRCFAYSLAVQNCEGLSREQQQELVRCLIQAPPEKLALIREQATTSALAWTPPELLALIGPPSGATQ